MYNFQTYSSKNIGLSKYKYLKFKNKQLFQYWGWWKKEEHNNKRLTNCDLGLVG